MPEVPDIAPKVPPQPEASPKPKPSRADRGKPRPRPAKDYELRMIADKWQAMTDSEIAAKLARPLEFVVRTRKVMQILRPEDPEYNAPRAEKLAVQLPPPPHAPGYDDALDRLSRSQQFRYNKASLTKGEVDFYSNKYIEMVGSIGELQPSEEDTLHLMLMELIRQNRILQEEKEAKNNPAARRSNFDDQYHDSVERFRALQRSLKVSRDQRLKDKEEGGVTFVKVVQRFNEERNLEKSKAEIVAIKKEKEDWLAQNSLTVTEAE